MSHLKVRVNLFIRKKSEFNFHWENISIKLALISLETQTFFKINLLKECEFSLYIISNYEIQLLNNKYRNINKATDVLSFPSFFEINKNIKKLYLGEIFISIDKLCEQAELYNHSKEREACFLLTHGFLHLLGYDHEKSIEEEKIMFNLQEKIIEKLKL